jgi:ATP-dependent DNA helicase RecQ
LHNVAEMAGFRPNLRLEVRRTANEPQKRQQLTRLIEESAGTGIVYAATVRHVDLITEMLLDLGFRAAKDHARVSPRQRTEAHEAFMAGRLDALVATSAFGASVQRRDMRFVIHYSTPGSLREYHAEISVAGRAGDPVRCVLFYEPDDALYFGGGRYPTRDEIGAVHGALSSLGASESPVTLTPLNEAARMAPAETRVVLAVLKELGVIKEHRGSRIALIQPDLTREALNEMASEYLTRHAAYHRNVAEMKEYALTDRCRWKVMLEFLDEDADWGDCGMCDTCRRAGAQPPAEPWTVDRSP